MRLQEPGNNLIQALCLQKGVLRIGVKAPRNRSDHTPTVSLSSLLSYMLFLLVTYVYVCYHLRIHLNFPRKSLDIWKKIMVHEEGQSNLTLYVTHQSLFCDAACLGEKKPKSTVPQIWPFYWEPLCHEQPLRRFSSLVASCSCLCWCFSITAVWGCTIHYWVGLSWALQDNYHPCLTLT